MKCPQRNAFTVTEQLLILQVSSGEVITIKEGCRKEAFLSTDLRIFPCRLFRLVTFPARHEEEGDRVGGFLQGLKGTVPKASSAPSKRGPCWRRGFSSSCSPHQQGWPPLLGLHTSPFTCFPMAWQKEVQMPWQRVKSDGSAALVKTWPASSRCPWLGFPHGQQSHHGQQSPSHVTVYERGGRCVVLHLPSPVFTEG